MKRFLTVFACGVAGLLAGCGVVAFAVSRWTSLSSHWVNFEARRGTSPSGQSYLEYLIIGAILGPVLLYLGTRERLRA